MKKEFLEHYELLVSGMYILCQQFISIEMLMNASRALKQFVSRFVILHGIRYMTCNLHSFLHFVDIVKDLRPMWVYSCFRFEDLNGKLK